MKDRIQLYSDACWISPYGFSVYVALREKNLPFEYVPVSLADKEQHRPDFRARAVTGKIPALAHDGFWLTESSAIIEYLEETFPAQRMLPVAPRDRARARQIMSWIRSDLMPLRSERPTTSMFYERAKSPLSDAGAQAASSLVHVAEALLPGGSHSLFSEFSIADADLAFMLQRLILNGHEVPARLHGFADAVFSRPAVREFVERERPPYRPY